MKVNNSDVLEKINTETLNLIITYGVKGWTMDTVCKKSSLAKDTLYRIIGTKEQLIKNVFFQILEEHNQRMSALLNQDKDIFDIIKEVTAELSTFLGQFSLERLDQVFREYPSVEKAINEQMESFFVDFGVFLNEGKRSGKLKDHVDPNLLIKIIHSCIMQFLKQPETFNATNDVIILLDYLIEGVRNIPA